MPRAANPNPTRPTLRPMLRKFNNSATKETIILEERISVVVAGKVKVR
jgi:hypothetical protein